MRAQPVAVGWGLTGCSRNTRSEYHGEQNELKPDFKEFLQSLDSYEVEHLDIGGYAVTAKEVDDHWTD